MITAPYNFVPLNKEVFYPDWADKVSHDIPFEDGESGEIEVTITAKSPLFIRNHYQEGDDYYEIKKGNQKIKISKEFCHYKLPNYSKQFYIPGSSIKGMIRNIVEIITFSEIRIDKEKWKKRFAARDMTPKQYCADSNVKRMKDCPQHLKKSLFAAPMVATAQKCGFLKIHEDGSSKLYDCGQVVVISHQELKNNYNISELKKCETAQQKYNKTDNTIKTIQVNIKLEGRRKKAYYQQNAKQAALVFTGDITNKKHEFVFIENGRKTDISPEVIENFKTVYFSSEENVDGQYWKQKYKKNKNIKIPIFYVEHKGSVEAIGLTQIFKLAYKKTILNAASQNTQKGNLDFSQVLFGAHEEEKGLKGRVFFSHFPSNLVRFEPTIKSEVLGTPNPTYYPNYIEQKDVQYKKATRYTTLMDNCATIRGYKQYPLQPNIQSSHGANENEDVKTQFKPLNTGSIFRGKLRFHNLKKSEIGALLSALTWHKQGEDFFHNIGMAKPLGYGKIKIDIEPIKLKFSIDEYLNTFETLMNNWQEKTYTQWCKSAQITELYAMHNDKNAKSLSYQLLANARGKNDFTEAKKERKFLLQYTNLVVFNETHKKQKNVSAKKNIQKEVQSQHKVHKNKHNKQTPKTIKEVYEKYDSNIVQIIAAFKAGQFDRWDIDKKILAKELWHDLQKDKKLFDSQKQNNIQRKEFLQSFLK